jgi:hypothetical protein
MLPNQDKFKMWVANNITEDGEKSRLQERVTACFNELRESGLFNTDSSKMEEVSGEASNVKKGDKNHVVLTTCLGMYKGFCEHPGYYTGNAKSSD